MTVIPAASPTSIDWIRQDPASGYDYGLIRTDRPDGKGVYRAWFFDSPHRFIGAFDSYNAACVALWNELVFEMPGLVGLALPSTISTSSLGDL